MLYGNLSVRSRKKTVQTKQMHSEMKFNWHDVSFTWYSVFQKWKKKGIVSDLFRCSINILKETDYCWIHVCWFQQKWENLMLSPVSQVCFFELKWELEHICKDSFLVMFYCTESKVGKFSNNGMMLESVRSWVEGKKSLIFQSLWQKITIKFWF